MITVGSDFSGVGAFNQSLIRLGIDYKEVFACDMDKFARQTFIENYGGDKDKEVLKHEDYIKIADIFQREFVDLKLKRPTKSDLSFAYANCESISRMFSFYYPWNVYDREIPKEPLDIYMTSPPCQGFSMAGKRQGSVLFYNSHEFIQKNKPRYFIFENVKGLLSHEGGTTFQTWIDYLGGKTVNGNPVIFPRNESVPYHIFHKVINAKKCGVPQNRERIFIVGVRDDKDALTFKWDKDVYLQKCLKDVLESDVNEKYFLSDKMLEKITYNGKCKGIVADLNKGGERGAVYSENSNIMSCLSATDYKQPKQVLIGAIRGRNPDNPKSRVAGLPTDQQLEINENGTSNALTTVQKDNVVVYQGKIIQLNNPTHSNDRVYSSEGLSPTLNTMQGGNRQPFVSNEYKIRRLTPRECFRLMDFPESFNMPCSDSQMYKQAGNSIVVSCLSGIIKNFNL